MNQSAKTILGAYETEQLKSRLMDYPRQIFNKKKDVRQLRDVFANAELTRSLLEAEIQQDINDEKDHVTGKAKYSNEGSRAAELVRRKADSREYQRVAQESKQANYSLSEAQDELEMLMDSFKAARYVMRLISEEIALMGAEDVEDEDPLGLPIGLPAKVNFNKEPY